MPFFVQTHIHEKHNSGWFDNQTKLLFVRLKLEIDMYAVCTDKKNFDILQKMFPTIAELQKIRIYYSAADDYERSRGSDFVSRSQLTVLQLAHTPGIVQIIR